MKDKIFEVLQRVGRSFMLPIALLPVAGLLLGIGSSFTNPTTLSTYRLDGIIYEGNFLYTILDIMSKTGSIVFDNLPLLFAMGVAIGMAKKEKEVAALSGAISYLIMNATISTLINAKGGVSAMAANSTTTSLGITTLQMGVFGGIIVGLGVAALHNRFYKIQLPQVLSFFGGTRFVPIICSIAYLGVGIFMFYVWPMVQFGISELGLLVLNSGYLGTWIYGLIERALIPFGLHHVFYMPFWQTELGGAMIIDGVTVQGAQNIFFAQLASKSTTQFSVSATRFMSGKFPFMIFGLPAAAYAMYKTATPEKKKTAGGLLFSAALTSVLTGITEPLEFTFLFVAPVMYVVHCVLAGLSYMLMHILNVGVGMTFSGGLIDLTLFGILQGNAKTNWIYIVIVGIIYAIIYYFVFYLMITRLNLKTPGRESGEIEAKLYTRKDVEARKTASGTTKTPNNGISQDSSSGTKPNTDNISVLILSGLGGRNNISDLDCCATRLRVTVEDSSLVRDELLKQSGASGVIRKGNGVQIIYGPQVSVIKSHLEDYLEQAPDGDGDYQNIDSSFILYAHADGTVLPLEDVPDDVFSGKILGEGIAIEPSEGSLYAPCNGTISMAAETGHAVTIISDEGCEILLHIGIDTVELGGKFFTTHVKSEQKIRKGDLLVSFDTEQIEKLGYSMAIPLIICNSDEYNSFIPMGKGEIRHGKELLKITN
ncbi:MAG: glucose PTS transporter subunit IIA [Lachnospiraceae bacterium]